MSKHHVTNKHHRKPQSRGGDDSARNISVVNQVHHQAWHVLFANMHPDFIATIINQIWLDPDYEFIVRQRKGDNHVPDA